MPATNNFRVRKGFRGTCVLQRLIDYPSLIGGKVDASLREYVWEDVPWSNAPTTIKCYRGEEAIMRGESNAPKRECSAESGWVIELAASELCSPQYWAGSSLWVPEHLRALRFARKQDAQQAADFMLDGMKIRICEHVWNSGNR